MRKREQRHPRPRLIHRVVGWVPDVIVVLALVAGFVQTQYDLAGRFGLIADPATLPAAVRPPAGVTVPEQPVAPAVAEPASARPDAGAVQKAVSGLLGPKFPAKRVVAQVVDLDGNVLFESGSAAVTPASNTKLLTGVAALAAVGPDTRFRTSVKLEPNTEKLHLVGGGDPYLGSTAAKGKGKYPRRVTTYDLAVATAKALQAKGVRRVTLSYDASLFSGPAVNPRWPSSYISEMVVPPISALWVDQGHKDKGWGNVDNPAAAAAATFARQLRGQHIDVRPKVTAARTPESAEEVARVDSAPLGQIVQNLVSTSDNNATEVVLRHLGLAVNGEGSFVGGTKAMLSVLGELGVDVASAKVYDGSGLSRDNRLTANTLTDVLRMASDPGKPQLRSVIAGLSVAGFQGSLANRFDKTDPAARGRVMAKTGTLTGVHGLAGVATDQTGAPMVFAILADGVPLPKTLAARLQLDKFAAALGACSCAGP